ncbi:hypothetical protein T439DRAFT_365328 [Meredithblackwellia eburnea MCA 4105]
MLGKGYQSAAGKEDELGQVRTASASEEDPNGCAIEEDELCTKDVGNAFTETSGNRPQILDSNTASQHPGKSAQSRRSKLTSLQRYHRAQLQLQLVHSLHASFVLSYILSPAHLLPFIVRLLTQSLIHSPNPNRSLRVSLFLWAAVNSFTAAVHAVEGSVGTKGNGWNGKGLIVDIIGQAHTPSKPKLLSLDILIAFIQFLVVLMTYGTTPTSTDGTIPGSVIGGSVATTAPQRSALLGDRNDGSDEGDEDEFESEWGDEKPVATRRCIAGASCWNLHSWRTSMPA